MRFDHSSATESEQRLHKLRNAQSKASYATAETKTEHPNPKAAHRPVAADPKQPTRRKKQLHSYTTGYEKTHTYRIGGA